MEKAYRLNLNMQPNGDHEVHADDCRYYPTLSYESLGGLALVNLLLPRLNENILLRLLMVVCIVLLNAIQGSGANV